MKRKVTAVALTAVMVLSMSSTTLAASWQKDSIGWWWQNENGSYPFNTWQWIDGNGDGIAECYYFNENGYCLLNTTTPDGYRVNSDGAWVVNGVIQTQEQQTNTYLDNYSGVYTVPYYESENNFSYHMVTLTYHADSNTIVYSDPAANYQSTYTYFGTGLNGWTAFELETEEEKESIFFSAPGVFEKFAWDHFESIHRN